MGRTSRTRQPSLGATPFLRRVAAGPNLCHAQSKVQNPRFNGRCERFFRTLKLWQRLTIFFVSLFDIQSKAELFRGWYNEHRVHQGVNGRTPNEVWNNTPPTVPVRYLALDHMHPVFSVAREHLGADPNLPVFDIKLKQLVKRTA